MNSNNTIPDALAQSVSNPHPDRVENIWTDCLHIIRARVNNQNFKAWFEPIVPLRFDDSRFIVQVPSQFFLDWLEEHYYSLLNEALTQVTRQETSLGYEIRMEDRDAVASNELALSARAHQNVDSD